MTVQHVIGIICAICLAGCAGRAGQMKTSPELTRAFEEGRPPPEYRYYVTGREQLPNAVIGIDRKYEQKARFWREIEPESDALDRAIRNLFPYRRETPRASYLLSPDGDIIGVYWSAIYWTTIRFGENNAVWVYPPRVPDSRGFSGWHFYGSTGGGVAIGCFNGWNGWAAVNRVTNACGSWSSS